jgi:hypothetical protein
MRQLKSRYSTTLIVILGVLCITAAVLQMPNVNHGVANAAQPGSETFINEAQVEFATRYIFDKKAKGGLPSLDHIKAISAEVYSGLLPSSKVPRFEVPKENFKDVMSYFSEARIDSDPNLGLPESGVLLVTTDDGRTRSIVWFSGWKGPLCFSVKGIRCYSARMPDEKEHEVTDPGGKLVKFLSSLAAKRKEKEAKSVAALQALGAEVMRNNAPGNPIYGVRVTGKKPDVAALVAAAKPLGELQQVSLDNAGLTDDDLPALAELTGITTLDLSGNQITDAVANLTYLNEVWVPFTRVTDQGAAAFRQERIGVKVER